MNGLFGERPYELLIFIIGTVILMIYSISNYMQTVARLDLYEKKIKMVNEAGGLKTLDTIGYCQRPVFSLAESHQSPCA